MLTLAFQDAPASPVGFSWNLVLFAGIFAFFYFFVIRPQSKQQKEHQRMLDALKAGDKVITSGGVWGEIDHVEAQKICLRVNDKTKIFVSRSAVTALQPESKEATKST
jgi:preprotein translocase subunit YajC